MDFLLYIYFYLNGLIQFTTRYCHFRWIHDYQDACVDKLERFMRGEAVPPRGDPIVFNARVSETQSVASDRTVTSRPSPQYQRTQSVGSEGTRTD